MKHFPRHYVCVISYTRHVHAAFPYVNLTLNFNRLEHKNREREKKTSKTVSYKINKIHYIKHRNRYQKTTTTSMFDEV